MMMSDRLSMPRYLAHDRPRPELLLPGDQCGQTSQAVAGQLRRTAIGIEQAHRGGAIAQLGENQSIGADAGVPRAEMSREIR